MAITLTNFLVKINNLLDDNLTGTTTADGSTDKTTFIDSNLCKYDDGFFGDPERNIQWWAYVSSQLKSIKSFASATGEVMVYSAFSAQIAASTAYELHRFDRNKKIKAANQALNDCYPYFYKRIEDATTLDGKGSSDNEYTVPNTFTEFPDQIWQKHTATNVITYTQITDYDVTEIGGTFYFRANITLDDDIVLIGKKPLTAFTNDASTTELTDTQAEVVALLAASIMCRNLSATVNATDSGRFDSLANRYEQLYLARRLSTAMPILRPLSLDWSWNE